MPLRLSQGMQRQPNGKTIEQELEAALCRAGCISADNAGSFTKARPRISHPRTSRPAAPRRADSRGTCRAQIHWSRAARTDKGVSAMGQVVSLKMMVDFPDVVARINKELPEDIRVYGYTRATEGFDSRLWCDRRRYEYILPAWALDPAVCRGRNWELHFRQGGPLQVLLLNQLLHTIHYALAGAAVQGGVTSGSPNWQWGPRRRAPPTRWAPRVGPAPGRRWPRWGGRWPQQR
jgi:tRNA U38,U39,U40 pseudouridine synthase TruA